MNYELIAVDPGNTTGWARFRDGEIQEYGTIKEAEIFDWIASQTPEYWICEDYIIRTKGYSHDGDKGVALQIKGAIRLRCAQTGAILNLQQPSLKPGAYAQMGATYVKGKANMHHMDAMAHGMWYINHKLGGGFKNV